MDRNGQRIEEPGEEMARNHSGGEGEGSRIPDSTSEAKGLLSLVVCGPRGCGVSQLND